MSLSRPSRGVSLATAATLALGLAATGTVLAAPAQSADPVSDCVAPFPVDELAEGDAVTGLTVTRGTTPVGFTGEVIGVLESGIAPGLDMVMAELDMDEFDRTGGIWQGMSGSPVYAEDGRLIGAVAYGLSWGPSPIAGITPFADMDDHLGQDAGGRVPLGAADARAVATRAGITAAQASEGFRELPMPMGVSGVAGRRIAQLEASDRRWGGMAGYVVGRASAPAAGAETVVAGGNLAASVAYGDVSLAGVGTATSVCEGRVVGFGHPMSFLGETTLGLHPASALYVQPDPVSAPYKLANVAPPVGTVTDDRLTGITGTFGAAPKSMRIVSELSYGARSRTGTTEVTVEDFAAEATYYGILGNQDRVVDGPTKGSELLTWRITGTERGKPFTLAYTDRYSGDDVGVDAAFGVADMVWHLSRLDGVSLTSVTAEADADADRTRHTLARVEQRRDGRWVRVTEERPAVARPGGKVWLRTVLGGSAGRVTRNLPVISVPRRAAGTLVLAAQGGASSWSYPSGDSVAELRKQLASQLRRDQVRLQVGTRNRVDLGYEEEYYFRDHQGGGRFSFVQTRTSAPLGHVVDGALRLKMRVLPRR